VTLPMSFCQVQLPLQNRTDLATDRALIPDPKSSDGLESSFDSRVDVCQSSNGLIAKIRISGRSHPPEPTVWQNTVLKTDIVFPNCTIRYNVLADCLHEGPFGPASGPEALELRRIG
jgi:hypothetical protein